MITSALVCAWFDQSGISSLFTSLIACALLITLLFNSHDLAFLDELTGLPGRRALMNELKHCGKYYCLAMADIDHFKIINDTHGHLMGDEVLKKVAKMLSSNLRHIDLTGRWGGEEFIMILPGTTAEQGQEVIDRIRIAITEVIFTSTSTNANFNITVSFGVCDSQLASLNLKDMIAKADQALYQAKSNGRNQVVLHLEAADIATFT